MQTGKLENKSVLITGGAGFIGSNITSQILENNDIRIIDSLVRGKRSRIPDGAELVEGDIRNNELIIRETEDIDLIFHEAALVDIQQSIENPLESHEINVTATLELLEAARRQDIRVVIASSAAIYGTPKSIPISETDCKEPKSIYGLNKLTIDHITRQYHDLYGIDTTALRYFNVYGPGQVAGDYSGVISIFIEQALSGEEITVHGDGSQTRDFVYIDDVVQANRQAALTEKSGEAYNIGTGESITIRRLAELIQDITGTESEITHLDAQSGDIDHSEADISKATTELNYEPKVSLEEGIGRTVDWYRKRRN